MEDRASALNSLLSKYEELILAEMKSDLESKIDTKLTQIETDMVAKLAEMLANINAKLTEVENILNLKFSEKTSEITNDLNSRFAELNRNNYTFERERNRLETIRIAQLTLIENSKSLPVESRDVTAEKIQEFANSLNSYVTSQ